MESVVICVHRHGKAIQPAVHAAEQLARRWSIRSDCYYNNSARLPFNDNLLRMEANDRALRSIFLAKNGKFTVRRAVLIDYDVEVKRDPTNFIQDGSPPGTASDMSNASGRPFRTMLVPPGTYGKENLTETREISAEWNPGVFDHFRRQYGRLPDALDLCRKDLSERAKQIVASGEWRSNANCALLASDESADGGAHFLSKQQTVLAVRVSCELFRRGTMDDLHINDGGLAGTALATVLAKIHELTHAPTFYLQEHVDDDTDWANVRRDANARRRWIPGVPMVMRFFSINSPEAIIKYLALSRRKLSDNLNNGSGKNMVTIEESINGVNLTVNSLIRPLADCAPDVLRDYVADLSGLTAKSPYPANRKPLKIRMGKCSADFRTMHFDRPVPEDHLPKVSVLTITRNRRALFAGAVHCFRKIEYPLHKLEWIVVDDSDAGQEAEHSIGQELLASGRVKIVRMKPPCEGGLPAAVGLKRQIACEASSGDILVIRDDDDYYCPQSVMIQVRTLLEYPECEIVGSSRMLSYNVRTGVLFFTHSPNVFGENVAFPEPTIAFRRTFWKARPWQASARMDEGRHFQLGRDTNKFVEIVCHFIGIICSHGTNFTGNLRDGVGATISTNVRPEDVFPRDWWNIVKPHMLV